MSQLLKEVLVGPDWAKRREEGFPRREIITRQGAETGQEGLRQVSAQRPCRGVVQRLVAAGMGAPSDREVRL